MLGYHQVVETTEVYLEEKAISVPRDLRVRKLAKSLDLYRKSILNGRIKKKTGVSFVDDVYPMLTRVDLVDCCR